MLLAIDIGNSTVTMGLFEQEALAAHWSLATDRSRTADEYVELIRGLLEHGKVNPGQIRGAIVSTVVPALEPIFVAVIERLTGRPPVVVSPTMDSGLSLAYRQATELGPDRLANAVAAHARYPTDTIVVDFGTATTLSVVTATGQFLGGAIAPGVRTGAEALAARTARLPAIELAVPSAAIGRDTVGSLQSGILLGHAGLVDGLVDRMQQQLGQRTTVVATGGHADLMAPLCRSIYEVRRFLTLEGLEILYRRHSRQ
jgi:type III pantothenate kinase